jgi:dethiobiotin synthetase/adenosylmethionine--8-amino-7-oxononanoate aminotransferase
MLLVDPLYQRCLAAECRRRGVPVVFDEVFTGIWRLGALSAAQRLGVQPDIACYAKLLTGRHH